MIKKLLLTMCGLCCLLWAAQGQTTVKQLSNIKVSTTEAKLLGKIPAVRTLKSLPSTTPEKKNATRKLKKVPDNFKGRRNISKAVHLEKEHQGVDPVWQKDFSGVQTTALEPFVNIDGIGNGSPNDPTGDVSDEFYMQAVNATDVAVYDLEGNLVQEFAMNTLWATLNASSEGDPIILYDEVAEKWVVTEFTDPANLLIAISDTKDPLGSYNAYTFATPNFPDYPKYAITPEAIVVTTNEGGAANLHQYFIDRTALYAGAATVNMQRVEITGSTGTEQGFYTSTPVDWNGKNLPFDNKPIALRLNDSSWSDGPAQDQIEIYTFDVDFANQSNTTVTQSSVITAPFDAFPCSQSGFGFQCIPQQGGGGLDGVPEVILNIPHLRNFGGHESMVFNFGTDATNGQNRSGIRWMEFRRTSATTPWTLYQEGTFAPDDGKDRFMGSVAMDEAGNIGLGYNISSLDSWAGVRFTGRFASDPLGMMTIDEYTVVDGMAAIQSGGRFGDYSQMSVSPANDRTFWFTTEYAGNASQITETRIVAFQMGQDSFDLTTRSIINPTTSATLTNAELVTTEIFNAGINPIDNYSIGLIVDGTLIQTIDVAATIAPDESVNHQFTAPVDLSMINDYDIVAFVNTANDENPLNDTLAVVVSQLPQLDAGLTASVDESGCDPTLPASIQITNFGADVITAAVIEVIANGTKVGDATYAGSISYTQSAIVNYTIDSGIMAGANNFEFNITSVNGTTDASAVNNSATATADLLEPNSFITLVINSDNYFTETSWELFEQGTTNLVASGDLELEGENIAQICLPLDGCYTLVVMDSYGDGICCDFGEGDIVVLDNIGNTLVYNDGDFADETSEDFCATPGDCALTATIAVDAATTSASSDGSIMITAADGVGPYSYSIDAGATSQLGNLFTDLPAGDYNILVTDGNGICTYEETVTVPFISTIYEVNGQTVSVEILPNPNDGVFQVNVNNLALNDPLLTIEIYDAVGKLVQQRKLARYDDIFTGTLSLYAFPAGSYFLRINNKEINILEKIVKL